MRIDRVRSPVAIEPAAADSEWLAYQMECVKAIAEGCSATEVEERGILAALRWLQDDCQKRAASWVRRLIAIESRKPRPVMFDLDGNFVGFG